MECTKENGYKNEFKRDRRKKFVEQVHCPNMRLCPYPIPYTRYLLLNNMLIKHFQIFAQYNTLANHKLYDVCAQLSDAERKRIRPAFFKSIHATLNHIMVGDCIWLTRFEGKQIPSTQLNTILYEDFNELSQARVAEDLQIETFAAGLT